MKKTKLFYGWILCLTGTLMLIGGSGIVVNCAGQFLVPVTQALNVTRSQFSLYTSMVSVSSMIFCPLLGKFYEKWKPHHITIFGGLFMAAAWTGLSFARSIWQFYVLGFMIGIGSSMCGMVSVNILMNNWFQAKKGTAMGIALTGTGIGSMIFNPVAQKLIANLGYQAAYRILTGCMLLCMLPLFFLYCFKPEEKGLVPLGAGTGAGGKGRGTDGILRREAMKQPAFWAVCYVVFGLSVSSMGLFNHMQAHLQGIGYTAAAASLYLSSLSLGMTAAKLLFGWLNDKIGVRWNFLAMTLLSLTGIILLLVSRSPVLTVIGVMLFGVGAASPFVLTPQLTIRLFGGRDFANLYGTINVFQFLGPALGPVISGAIYDRTGSYTTAFVLYACVLAVAIVIGMLLLRRGAAGRAQA